MYVLGFGAPPEDLPKVSLLGFGFTGFGLRV